MLSRLSGAEFGMLVVETIAKIRRAHFVQGKPIKQICRELKLSRKVVRKVLRSEETAFEYKRSVQASAVGRPVEVRAYADRVELRQGEPAVVSGRSIAIEAAMVRAQKRKTET